MKKAFAVFALLISVQTWAGIPATPVMTLYRFAGDLEIPYYDADRFAARGASSPTGTLAQGTSIIPCLVIHKGRPLTDGKGTPYVGFEIVVDSRKATRADTARFKRTLERRKSLKVPNHHCSSGNRHVVNVRSFYALKKAPFFDPPGGGGSGKGGQSERDRIVRAFHNSKQCEGANRRLIGRRTALQRAWDAFVRDNKGRWSDKVLAEAKHLDYTMRTALYEGHLDRGCNAYGACERNVIALSIRNRARGKCSGAQGCRFPGDFQGAASKVTQYNIWDEFLTQISGLTSCFLRDDLARDEYYGKIQAMYEQNVGDVQRILFASDQDLRDVFPGNSLGDLLSLRHYYHAPAMGKCFPNHDRVEYMSGAVAKKGGDFALIADTRIKVGRKTSGGYRFQEFRFRQDEDRDVISILDSFPSFIVDDRKVSLRKAKRCPPYGIPRGCRLNEVGRYRKTPPWLSSGRPLELTCKVQDRGEQCRGGGRSVTAKVGGTCDTQMRPVTGVP